MIRYCHPEFVEGSPPAKAWHWRAGLANARRTPIQARFLVSLGMTLIAFAFLLLNSHRAFAQNVRYPISQLNNCRDARECKFYCEIPAHTPACWSYGKYVINKNVLGESTVNVSYPIAELGNCISANECFIFCNQPQNQKTCYDFAKSRGLIKEKPKLENIIELAKKELGCQNDLECMVFCQQPDNMSACRTFAQKYKLVSEPSANEAIHPSTTIIEKAKNGLGCSSETECKNFCNNPDNREKCFAFAKENNLLSEKEIAMHEEFSKKEKEIIASSKEELGCDSPQTCKSICESPENSEKCFAFAKKNNLIKPEEVQEIEKHKGQKMKMVEAAKTELGCDSESSCMKICSDPSNREKCMNMGKKFGLVKEVKEGMKSQTPQSEKSVLLNKLNQPPNKPISNGEFLGPGGCKSESECKAYCEKHPTECPGFPIFTSSTGTSSASSEFPPDCAKNAECRAKYCAKYPSGCTTVNQNSPTQAPQDGNNHNTSPTETPR